VSRALHYMPELTSQQMKTLERLFAAGFARLRFLLTRAHFACDVVSAQCC